MDIKAKGFKVYLSSLSMDDVDEIAKQANDKDVVRGLSSDFPFPYERKHAISFIEGAMQLMAMGRGFHFGIRKVEDNKLVGVCGSAAFFPNSKKCEIGFWLGKQHWGKGYAKDAVRLLLHFSFDEMGINRVFAESHVFNERSAGLLKKLGFKEEGRLREASIIDGKFVDDVVFSMLKKEYKDKLDVKMSGR